MTVNLLDLVKGAVGSQMGPLAGILGESEQNTNSAINAALPALLGGLMKKASTPSGAGEIFKATDDFDGGMLDNLGGLLGGGNHTSLLQKGSSILGLLFGSNQSGLLGTIAKMAGIGNSKAGTILGLLAPIVMSMLGKQRRASNLDAGGLANLLSSQKDHLKGSMPGEIADTLGLGDVFGNVKSAATATAHSAGRAATQTASDAGKAGGGLFKMLLPLLVLGALAFWAYSTFSKPKIVVPEGTAEVATPDFGKIDIPGFDNVTETFTGLTNSISDIKGIDGAHELLPKIQDASTMIDGLDLGAIAAGPQKEAVTGMMSGLILKLRTVLDTAYAIPGVREILEPVITPFLNKFQALGL